MSDQHPLAMFDQVKIINLPDRADRRREMVEQLEKVGGLRPNIAFFEARRPSSRGEFESIGARGCFESHLSVLREARLAGAGNLLILEDDFDFSRDGASHLENTLSRLQLSEWDIFYGAHVLQARGRDGIVSVPPSEPILTAAFVAFSSRVIPPLVDFLEALYSRPSASPGYGPMHVDGAYTTFRQLRPEYRTFGAFPPLGKQRSSRSDITPSGMLLDRWVATRGIASLLRRTYNRLNNT